MTVAQVRALVPDKPVYEESSFSGDGARVRFHLPNAPVVSGSAIVTVAGTLKALTTDYTVDLDLGLVTFVSAPTNGAAVVIAYQHTLVSDEDIETALSLQGSDVYMAAADVIDIIASNQVLILKVVRLLDVQTDGAAVSRELRQRSKQLRENAASVATVDFAEMVVNDFSARERVYKEALRG